MEGSEESPVLEFFRLPLDSRQGCDSVGGMNEPKRFSWAVSVLVVIVLCVIGVGLERGDKTWHVLLNQNGESSVIERGWWGFGQPKLLPLRSTEHGWHWSEDGANWKPVPVSVLDGVSGAD